MMRILNWCKQCNITFWRMSYDYFVSFFNLFMWNYDNGSLNIALIGKDAIICVFVRSIVSRCLFLISFYSQHHSTFQNKPLLSCSSMFVIPTVAQALWRYLWSNYDFTFISRIPHSFNTRCFHRLHSWVSALLQNHQRAILCHYSLPSAYFNETVILLYVIRAYPFRRCFF